MAETANSNHQPTLLNPDNNSLIKMDLLQDTASMAATCDNNF